MYGAVSVSILISNRYQTSPLSTVVESTNVHVYEIPYPAISVCNSHRINTHKVNQTMKRFLPNASKEDIESFRLLLNALEVLDFGSFEEFDSLKGRNLSALEGLNITKLIIESEETTLWRSTSFGEWSGFRGLLHVHPALVRRYTYPSGVLAIVHHPYEWPQQAKFIPVATSISIGIQPTAFYASSDVRRLTSTERQCIYKEEISSHAEEVMNLEGLPYLRANCMAECRQRAMMHYCNCTLDFFYPSKCSRIDYSIEVFEILGMDASNNSVALDIHFKSSTMLRYRTDLTFGWLDLMVAFGGIAGLFLGCSLLSGAELVYYLTIGLFWHNTNPPQHSRPSKSTPRTRHRINTISHGIEHVQHQWRLAKGNIPKEHAGDSSHFG
ncbi:uncharacterized protein LOC129791215 [Lutzomyia longipalpis]|uniref:uncharacterized protein LOC129791215 n=1 Tax=Lutzomyia longipalpis TaxID=7200 RepID=UPI00248421B8|nr:uncharacterized protein LOC129791215 [Lutzomyia longipalpis]